MNVRPGIRLVRLLLGANVYPTIAKWIDPARRYSQITYSSLLAELIPDGATWLDAGCGHCVFKLKSANDEAAIIARARLVVGCDLARQPLLAHRSLEKTVCADLSRLPFPDATFDVITMNYVVEHLAEPECAFAETARVLKSGGILVLVTPNSRGYFVRLGSIGRSVLPKTLINKFIFLREYRPPEDVFPTFYRSNTVQKIRGHMKTVGLEEKRLTILRDPAIFNFIAPLAIIELIAIRLVALLGFKEFVDGTIIGVYCRQ